MWKCEKCGKTFNDSDSKCWACGTHRQEGAFESKSKTSSQQATVINSDQQYCPKCNKTYDNSWKICLSCGAALIRETSKKGIQNDESEAKTKRSGGKTALYWVIGVIVLIFISFLSRYGGNSPTESRVVSNPPVNMGSLSWQRQNLGSTGMSLESPIELKEIKMPASEQALATGLIKDAKIYRGNIGDLSLSVSMVQYSDINRIDFEQGANDLVEGLKREVSQKGGFYIGDNKESISISGKQGVIIVGEFKYTRNSEITTLNNIALEDGSKMWVITMMHTNNPNGPAITKRTIDSIRIE